MKTVQKYDFQNFRGRLVSITFCDAVVFWAEN